MHIQIRQERQEDYQQIRELVREAFALEEHSDGDEHNHIERIRHSPDYKQAVLNSRSCIVSDFS